MEGPEPINQILTKVLDNPQEQNNSTQSNYLSIKETQELPFFLIPDKAVELNFKLLEPVPESKKCNHCGNELKIIGRRAVLRRIIVDWTRHQECTCESAILERQRMALEADRVQKENEEADRRAAYQAKVNKLFAQSKLGERFKNRTFEMYQTGNLNQTAFETANNYAANFETLKRDGVGLIFNGGKGTGKTHLAAAITIDLIHRGIPVIMGTLISLLGMLKQAYQEKQSEQEIIDLYCSVDLLIIDDIGKEKVTDWVLEKLYSIINTRYENNLPVIITTNFDIDGLTARLSTGQNQDVAGAVTDRLWEVCIGVEMNWESHRRKQ